MSNANYHQIHSRRIPRWKLFGIGLVVLAFASLFAYMRFTPATALEDMELGMSDVEVTLKYGRPADRTELSDTGRVKTMTFYGSPGNYTEILLQTAGTSFKAYQICSTHYHASSKGIDYGSSKKDVIRRLGEPTYVSISPDGTRKMANFGHSNLAFEFYRDKIELYCVSRALPVKYANENGQSKG